MGSFLRVLGIKNNENENPISKLSILLCFLLVCVIDFSFSLCFTMILDAFLLKSCSKAAPAALGGSKIYNLEIGFSCSLFFMPKTRKNNSIPGSSGSCPRTAARHLPSTCAGGQDDGSSQTNSLKLGVCGPGRSFFCCLLL